MVHDGRRGSIGTICVSAPAGGVAGEIWVPVHGGHGGVQVRGDPCSSLGGSTKGGH